MTRAHNHAHPKAEPARLRDVIGACMSSTVNPAFAPVRWCSLVGSGFIGGRGLGPEVPGFGLIPGRSR